MRFSDYDRRLVMPGLHISEAPDPRTPEEAAGRIHDWSPVRPVPQSAAPSREFALEPTPHLIEFHCDHDTKQVIGSIDGRKCVARWDGVTPVPELMTRRGFVPANELRPGDVVQALEEETKVPRIQEVEATAKPKGVQTKALLKMLLLSLCLDVAIIAIVVIRVLHLHAH